MKEKTGGRKKGTPNKATKDLRQWITAFIDRNTAQIETDWQNLEPKERIVFFERLLKYTLPQLQAVSSTVDFEKMSDEDLDRIIQRLTSKQRQNDTQTKD